MMVAAVLLDVVDSRSYDDQVTLLRTVTDVVQQALVEDGRATSAGPTVGDEFQALYDHPAVAVHDVTRLRMRLGVDHGVAIRAGFGIGEVVTSGGDDATAPGQSGSAWWNARSALETATTTPKGWPARRWWLDGEGPEATALRAVLVALDTIAPRLDDDDVRHALRLLDGATQRDLVEAAGVSQSTMSARLHGHGVYGWVRTLQLLAEGVPS